LAPENGRVGISGLRALYLAMGLQPSVEELEVTIQQIDKKGYGTVSLDEFINNL
jgi:Ca2+-binding EF-hand superfamily protein